MGSPGKNTWVGCLAHLQGIFPAQGLNPHLRLLHCSILLPSPWGSTHVYMCIHYSIYTKNTIELDTLNGQIVWCVNYISIKLLGKRNTHTFQPGAISRPYVQSQASIFLAEPQNQWCILLRILHQEAPLSSGPFTGCYLVCSKELNPIQRESGLCYWLLGHAL